MPAQSNKEYLYQKPEDCFPEAYAIRLLALNEARSGRFGRILKLFKKQPSRQNYHDAEAQLSDEIGLGMLFGKNMVAFIGSLDVLTSDPEATCYSPYLMSVEKTLRQAYEAN